MKKISVIVCAYNEEKYLPRCLESLTHQTFPPEDYEIIVVDNNSTDSTSRIAESFGVKVILEKKQGAVFAMVAGCNEASGEIVAVTDADTMVSKNWLSSIDSIFQDSTVVGAGGYMKVTSRVAEYLNHLFLAFQFGIRKPNLCGPNMAFRRSAYEAIGGVDTRYIASYDVDLGFRLKKIGRVVYARNMVVNASSRRWNKEPLSALWDYGKSYLWSVWFRKPPPVAQKPIR